MDIISILKKVGAVLADDHFVGTSGLHFDTYINKDFLYPHTEEVSQICRLFAEKYKDKGIEVVVGPALGGIILSQWTAHHLSDLNKREVLGVYTEKSPEGGQVFTRGYNNFIRGKKVLLVEDIVTTGGSLLKTTNAIRSAGGELVAACAMVNKTKDLRLGIPFDCLANLYVDSYEADKCPLCKKNIPINTKFGHGKKFLESKE